MEENVTEIMDTSENRNFADFKENGLKIGAGCTKSSNSLPTGEWDFYKLNAGFSNIMNRESNRLLGIVNSILRKYEMNDNIKARDIDNKMELLIEANDNILERVGNNLDEFNGIKTKKNAPVEFQQVSAELPINGSWNRMNKASFSISNSINSPGEKENSSLKVHLLTAKNIIRPQTFFKDKIDNSNNPWQPRITEKPNSIKPLALYMETTEFGDSFSHPYEIELEQFQPNQDQLIKTEPPLPKPVNETSLYEITEEKQLDDLVEELRNHKVIAIDLEHHSYRTFMGITCLMQISTTEADYLIDTLALRHKLYVLNEIFTRPSIVKVFHGADLDVQWLQRDLSLYVVNMFDTHQAAKQLGYSGLSLAYLLQRYCKFAAQKQFQLADWRIRPLPDELKMYAREDTHYLIYIYHTLKNELLKKANGCDNVLRAVLSASTEICKKRYFKPILTEDSHMDFYTKCKRMFDNRQMYALKGLYQWRDKVAREEDESTGYVLPNHMMLQIAENLPREMQGILACCNPIPPLVKANLLTLHQIILKAREQSVQKPILKESVTTERSAYKINKINLDSPLYCPHEISKQTEVRDDLPTLLGSVKDEYAFPNWKKKLEATLISSSTSFFDKPMELSSSDEEMEEPKSTLSRMPLTPYQRYMLTKTYAESQDKKEKIETIKQECN